MKINSTKILFNNPCYVENFTQSKKYTDDRYKTFQTKGPKGIMLHSVGCAQPNALSFINTWNSKSHTASCVHGFIDANTGEIYQTLPWNFRGWHCGSGSKGSGNNTHIGIEMCEPSTIKYTKGIKFTCSNKSNAIAAVKRTYKAAVELFAHLCETYNLDPLKDGVIISHSEGHKRGIASNHADPEHLWKGLGLDYTMNKFRNDVKKTMEKQKDEEPTKESTDVVLPTTSKVVYRVQVGSYQNYDNALAMCKKLKNKKIDAAIVISNSTYKVQAGTYAVKKNAEEQARKLKKLGFDSTII